MIFVDTSFWAALRNRRDALNPIAAALYHQHAADRLITTNLVRGECWTLLRSRVGHQAAVGFLEGIEGARGLSVVRVSETLEEQALRWLRRHDERVYSFVDATSFMVMRDLGIYQALAFDGDFSAAGFVELRP